MTWVKICISTLLTLIGGSVSGFESRAIVGMAIDGTWWCLLEALYHKINELENNRI